MSKKNKVFLTAEALYELSTLVETHNDRLSKSSVAYIDKVDLQLMDEGAYALAFQDVKVSFVYRPEFDGIDNFPLSETDQYVIAISID